MLTVDQPLADGGEDTAPTPAELFVASVTSRVAFAARRYLARHGLPAGGLTVTAWYPLGPRSARSRIGIGIGIRLPGGVPEGSALVAVASHCTVHNSLTDPPQVTITLSRQPAALRPRNHQRTQAAASPPARRLILGASGLCAREAAAARRARPGWLRG